VAEYSTFTVASEADNYRLNVNGFLGNATFDAFSYVNGWQFTSRDRDNDLHGRHNCAVLEGGGFWYKYCAYCSVNTVRGRGDSFSWLNLPGNRTLRTSRMWLMCR
jgi:ficolin